MHIQVLASELVILAGLIAFGHGFDLAQWLAIFSPGNAVQERAKAPEQVVRHFRGMVTDHVGAIVPNYSSVEVRVVAEPDTAPTDKTAPPIMTQATDRKGGFSFDLPPGTYEICVSRFPKSCRVVEAKTESPPFLELKVNPLEDRASSELMDNRLRTIAGAGAENCGHVQKEESPKGATECALRAFKSRRAFYVRYDSAGFDSEVIQGIAGDAARNVYYVDFGDFMDSGMVRPGVTMPDGFHTMVMSCSKPVRLRRTVSGKLTCFSDGRWLAYDY
jgi:hypothetical protein